MATNETEKDLAQALNLSSYEAKMYLAGLNFGEATLTDLAKRAGVPRTAGYPPLQALLHKGLVSAIKIKKRVYYRSLPPQRLPYILEQNKVTLERAIDTLAQEITAPHGVFSVQYFAGIKGVHMAAEIFLNESKGKLWRTFEHPENVLKQFDEASFDSFNKRRIAKGIFGRVIMNADNESRWLTERLEKNKEELREVVQVSAEAYPVEASMAIADDMILMFTAKGDIFATLIKNNLLAKTFASIHDMVWDRYKK